MRKMNYMNIIMSCRPSFIKIASVVFLLAGYIQQVGAQDADFAWAKGMGGTGADVSYGVTTDATGNVYVTGSFNTEGDFNAGGSNGKLTAVGGDDAFLAKYDPAGKFLWAKGMGGTGTDIGYKVAVDAKGNAFVIGYFNSTTANFNPAGSGGTLTSAGNYDVFVAKYDPNGTFLWTKGMGGTGADYGQGIAVDANGNVCVIGYFTGVANFNSGGGGGVFTAAGNNDIFVARYDPNGTFLWAKGIGGTGADMGFGITTDANGNVLITGTFAANGANFNPGGSGGALTTGGFEDIFLAKYNSGGTFLWAKNMGGTGNSDRGFGVATDINGNVFVAGSYGRTGDFNPGGSGGLVNAAGTDVFLAKYDPAGTFLWVKGMGGKNADKGSGLVVDATGNAYVAGDFGENADFNIGGSGGELTAGSAHGFVVKYGPSGEFLWVKGMGSAGVDRAFSVAVHTNGSVFVTGFFYGTASSKFSPGSIASAGGDDAYLLRLNQGCQVYTTFTESTCDSFIFNTAIYTASGTYKDTFASAAKCDSIVTLNLTITGKASSNTEVSGHYCDSVSINGQTYTASGTYVQRYSNVVMCDSNIIYDLTIGHSNAGSVTVSVCDSFDFNGRVYDKSGVYFATFTNATGCDSGVVLNLTINNTPVPGVSLSGTTLSTGQAQSYQWVDCDKNYAHVVDAISQTFIPTMSGNYAVIVTTNDCSDTSDCVTVEVGVSVNDLGIGNRVQLYPNPADSWVTLQTDRALKNATISVVNVVGQIVQQQSAIYGTTFTLNMDGYVEGIYFVEINERGSKLRMKLVKGR